MAAVPVQQAAAAGGMVSMARGLRTALGLVVVTLTPHAATRLDHAGSGPAAMAVLASVGPLATGAGRGGAGSGACQERR
jgi:hypothetical protein